MYLLCLLSNNYYITHLTFNFTKTNFIPNSLKYLHCPSSRGPFETQRFQKTILCPLLHPYYSRCRTGGRSSRRTSWGSHSLPGSQLWRAGAVQEPESGPLSETEWSRSPPSVLRWCSKCLSPLELVFQHLWRPVQGLHTQHPAADPQVQECLWKDLYVD